MSQVFPQACGHLRVETGRQARQNRARKPIAPRLHEPASHGDERKSCSCSHVCNLFVVVIRGIAIMLGPSKTLRVAMLCEVCIRRQIKRQAAVAAIKNTPAYIVVKTKGIRSPTPDPENRNISKRSWERSVMEWRKSLREQLRELHVEQQVEQED